MASATGRFTQRDPFLGFVTDPLSLNRYTYAHNNPIRYVDPSGYAAVQVTLPDGRKVTATVTGLALKSTSAIASLCLLFAQLCELHAECISARARWEDRDGKETQE